jgi:hypothetical protein
MIIEFDPSHAARYGVTEAAVIAVVRAWFEERRINGEEIREQGRAWLTMRPAEFAQRTGFLTEQQARAVLGSLLFQGVIVTAPTKGGARASVALTFGFADEARFMGEPA